MIDIIVFNVRLGQCIFFSPHNAKEYQMLVDCGHDDNFHPIDALINSGVLHMNAKGEYEIGNLTLTNYDHDHFSGLPYLKNKAKIRTVNLAKNVSVDDLLYIKEETDALNALIELKKSYINDAINYTPPYTKHIVSLTQDELIAAGVQPTTNHLSQMVFIEAGGVVICIPGDIERASWELMLRKEKVTKLLGVTKIFFASHHGRDNGYHESIFSHCSPECVIISDKEIMHTTQQGMANLYNPHVTGNGIILKPSNTRRKVITTRNDGHILISIDANANVEYHTLSE